MNKWSRRAFIGAGTVAGGGFLLGVAGFTLAPGRHSLVSADAASTGQLTTWITINPDNTVTILIPHCEMGQGSQMALAMMTADELDATGRCALSGSASADDTQRYIVRAAAATRAGGPWARRRLRRLQRRRGLVFRSRRLQGRGAG